MEEDFSVQPKYLNGVKQKGKGGCSKSQNTKNKKKGHTLCSKGTKSE